MENSTFKKQIQNILVDNKLERYVGRQKSGKLEFKRLYRSAFTDKCFRRKEGEDGKDYHLLLFVDFSGSMVNSGRYRAVQSMLPLLIRGFQDIIDIEVVGFNMLLHKLPKEGKNNTFAEEFLNNKLGDLIRYKSFDEEEKGVTLAAGNHDGYLLAEAYNKYLRVKKGRNIIIVLSDGVPSCDYGRSGGCGFPGCGSSEKISNDLKKTVKEIEKEGIPVIGIGMETSSVEQYYSRWSRVDNREMLYEEVVKHLKTCVHKRIIG